MISVSPWFISTAVSTHFLAVNEAAILHYGCAREDFERLPHPVELALFRVLQEGQSNVHRHSGSPTASIRLAREAGTVLIEVRDLGRGLDPAALGGSTLGAGIAGMRERLRQLGGRVEIESGLPGTRLRAILPLEKQGT